MYLFRGAERGRLTLGGDRACLGLGSHEDAIDEEVLGRAVIGRRQMRPHVRRER